MFSRQQYRCFNIEWAWSNIFEFSNFDNGILEQVGTVCHLHSAKQQPSNIKHDVGVRPNVCKLTFAPPPPPACNFLKQVTQIQHSRAELLESKASQAIHCERVLLTNINVE